MTQPDKTPCIPMTIAHQRMIQANTKFTTLRAKRFEPGPYRMFSRGGGSIGYLHVTSIHDDPVIPADLPPAALAHLARTEGYDSPAAFMATLAKLRLDPHKPYWLHEIVPEAPHD